MIFINQKQYLIFGLIAVVVAGAAFFGGMKYQQSKGFAGRNFGQFANAQRGNNPGQAARNMGMGRGVGGQILSLDDKSITVKLSDGSSKIVLLTDSTSINKSDAGSKSDLKAGDTVAVFGATNSDGSVTASNIQLNPQMRAGQASQSGMMR